MFDQLLETSIVKHQYLLLNIRSSIYRDTTIAKGLVDRFTCAYWSMIDDDVKFRSPFQVLCLCHLY